MKEYPLEELDFELSGEPTAVYEANQELNMAWKIVNETGENLFLTGRAGTGKTTFLKKLRENSNKRMVVLAPTGVAAINAEGNTIHSFFQLPLSPYIPGKGFVEGEKRFFQLNKLKRRLISSMSLLVIDEISMVRPDILDGIDAMLRRYRNSILPFGGVQLLMIGDLRQLPPVLKEHEWELLSPYYPTPYFFESHALKKSGFQTIELTTVYRQTNLEFIKILNKIRDGEADFETLSKLNSRYISQFNPTDEEGYIRLTTHNRTAANRNLSSLSALDAPEFSYTAETTGDFPESLYPADKVLNLKVGAQVMFIRNEAGPIRRYYNGLIGKIVDLDTDSITVRPLHGGEDIEIERAEWENTRYAVDENKKTFIQEVVGTFTQFPLRLAWAITIHKSQGLTFDKAIIDAGAAFASGQTYVALSRCRSLEGLVLSSPLSERAVITDGTVNSFIEQCEQNEPTPEIIKQLQAEYLRKLLCDLFNFTDLRIAFIDFHRYVSEYIVPLYPSLDQEVSKAMETIKTEIEEVGQRFIKLHASKPIDPETFAQDRTLLDRIKRGCAYFEEKLLRVNSFINRLPKDISNKAYAQRLNNTYESLSDILRLRLGILTHLSEKDFSASDYIETKGRVALEIEGKATKSRAKKTKRAVTPDEKQPKQPKGYSTFHTYKLFKEDKSIPAIAEERKLALSTISSHLSELIEKGLLTLDQIMEPDTLTAIRTVAETNPDCGFGQILEKLNENRPEEQTIPNYLLSIYWKTLPENLKKKNN